MEELQNNIVIYNPSEDINLEVRVAEDTVWLTQAQMAKLLGTTSQNITLHIKNIYREHELETVRTCKDFLQVQMEGGRSVKRNIKTYNLDVIISVGYRVKSIQGTLFRIWANEIIKKHILKGYTINYQLTALQQSIEHRLESHEQQIQSG
ncbi:MAG: virulence RhuM family protein [Bacteroidales bacterium]|nr:virulence RhuM family protein [Bacteroidales bacterium]